jgi:hypothetical protein
MISPPVYPINEYKLQTKFQFPSILKLYTYRHMLNDTKNLANIVFLFILLFH